MKRHGLDKLIADDGTGAAGDINASVDLDIRVPFAPQWDDLVRLHRLVISRKVTTILEFGVGYSTVILAHALAENKQTHGAYVSENLRRHNGFEIHSVDGDEYFIGIARNRLPEDLRELVHFQFSDVVVGEFSNRICTYYSDLPNICPDLIYLDAPDQFIVKGHVRGITTAHLDRMPMAADLLAIEHFLLPGTLILVDGRTANARFLKANFQRRWHYEHDQFGDVHSFELKEPALGRHNRKQIEFCLGPDWFDGLED
jgi:hypothetical protein